MLLVNNLNLNGWELQNARIHLLAADPGSPTDGTIWVNTATNVLKARLGGTTVQFGRLDQMNAPTADVSVNNRKITNLADPTAGTEAATKAYVDALLQGFAWKDDVRAATTGNITLSGAQTIDGVAVVAGDRVLVKNQTTASASGLYTVASGAWTRTTDADTAADMQAASVLVNEGTTNGDTTWNLSTNAPITLGTTALTFVKTSGGAAPSSVNKYAANVGDGAATTISVLHNLATTDVTVEVWESAGNRYQVFPDTRVIDANTISLIFGAAPAASQYRVIVLG